MHTHVLPSKLIFMNVNQRQSEVPNLESTIMGAALPFITTREIRTRADATVRLDAGRGHGAKQSVSHSE